MSLFHQLPTSGSALNRRQAIVCLSVFALSACSPTTSTTTTAVDEGVDYYTCPMHPSVRSHKPNDKCPICGMDLVPVMKKSGKEKMESASSTAMTPAATPMPMPLAMDDSGTVTISPDRLKEIGANTAVVLKKDITRMLKAPARAEIDESSLRDINVKAGGGYITKLYANYVGKSFRKGEVLMTVLCEGWADTQINYIKAYRAYKRTGLMTPGNSVALDNQMELLRERIRVWDLSEKQIESLEKFALTANEIDLRTGRGLDGSFDLLAPFDGFVHMKNAIEGMKFDAGQSLLEIADHRNTWIVAEFPESQSMYLNVGQKVTVTFPSMPGHKVVAPIDFIDPHLDDQERRVLARIVISDENHMFHPGLFAEVSAEIPVGSVLTVPASAVVPTGDKFIVFIDRGGGKLEPREIQVGTRSGDDYEVTSGLKEGDHVISSANFLIDAESRIQGVLKTWGTN